jgi:hypothetical protein
MSGDTIFLHDPPPPEQRIAVLYAWIATHEDGSEGVIGGLLGGGWVPLVTAFLKTATAMEPLAENARVYGEKATNQKIGKRLVRFVREV